MTRCALTRPRGALLLTRKVGEHTPRPMRATRFAITSAGVIGLLLASHQPAAATDFYVYRAKLKIVAKMVIFNPTDNDTIITRKLGNNDIINLALGRPLGTKVDGRRRSWRAPARTPTTRPSRR